MLEKIMDLLAKQLRIDVNTLSPDTNIVEDLGADSLDIVELIMDFEKKFDIEIPDDDAGDKIATVGDAIKYIEDKVNAK